MKKVVVRKRRVVVRQKAQAPSPAEEEPRPLSPPEAWKLVNEFQTACKMQTLDGWRQFCDTPQGVELIRRREAPRRPKKGTGDLEKFLWARFEQIFGEWPPQGVDWRLLKNCIEHELQYRGHAETGALASLSANFLARREASRHLTWLALDTQQANLLRWAHPQEESTTEGGTKVAKKERAASFKKVPGKTLGLSIGETWQKLFRENANGPKAERKTDEQISAFMHREFPDRKAKHFDHPQTVRSYFNRGGFGASTAPKSPSVPYDKAGDPIEVKRGRGPGQKVKATKAKARRVMVKKPAAKTVVSK